MKTEKDFSGKPWVEFDRGDYDWPSSIDAFVQNAANAIQGGAVGIKARGAHGIDPDHENWIPFCEAINANSTLAGALIDFSGVMSHNPDTLQLVLAGVRELSNVKNLNLSKIDMINSSKDQVAVIDMLKELFAAVSQCVSLQNLNISCLDSLKDVDGETFTAFCQGLSALPKGLQQLTINSCVGITNVRFDQMYTALMKSRDNITIKDEHEQHKNVSRLGPTEAARLALQSERLKMLNKDYRQGALKQMVSFSGALKKMEGVVPSEIRSKIIESSETTQALKKYQEQKQRPT